MDEMYDAASETTGSGVPKAQILCENFVHDTCQHCEFIPQSGHQVKELERLY
jgi:hypothetical protein